MQIFRRKVERLEIKGKDLPECDSGVINKEASASIERSAQLLHGGIAPWSRQSAGIQEYSATPRTEQTAYHIQCDKQQSGRMGRTEYNSGQGTKYKRY